MKCAEHQGKVQKPQLFFLGHLLQGKPEIKALLLKQLEKMYRSRTITTFIKDQKIIDIAKDFSPAHAHSGQLFYPPYSRKYCLAQGQPLNHYIFETLEHIPHCATLQTCSSNKCYSITCSSDKFQKRIHAKLSLVICKSICLLRILKIHFLYSIRSVVEYLKNDNPADCLVISVDVELFYSIPYEDLVKSLWMCISEHNDELVFRNGCVT